GTGSPAPLRAPRGGRCFALWRFVIRPRKIFAPDPQDGELDPRSDRRASSGRELREARGFCARRRSRGTTSGSPAFPGESPESSNLTEVLAPMRDKALCLLRGTARPGGSGL